VPRTWTDKKLFAQKIESGQNSLFNVLKAYSKHNPEVGYCQGMNYLAALILVAVRMDEALAFSILIRLMEGAKHNFARLYEPKLLLLFELTDTVYAWLLSEEPILENKISSAHIPLATMLASPFMGLFANIAPYDVCLRVMDQFVLNGNQAMCNIIKQVLRAQKEKILGMSDPDVLHAYLVKQVYLDAI